jgi:hypothetical protein
MGSCYSSPRAVERNSGDIPSHPLRVDPVTNAQHPTTYSYSYRNPPPTASYQQPYPAVTPPTAAPAPPFAPPPATQLFRTSKPANVPRPSSPPPPAGLTATSHAPSLPAFYLAALDGDLPTLRREVWAGAPVNARVGPEDAPTALFAAVFGGNSQCVAFLLRQGADTEAKTARTQCSWTPLMAYIAGRRAEMEIIRELLMGGANVHAESSLGDTPLTEAERHYARRDTTSAQVYELLQSYDHRLPARGLAIGY